MNLSSTFNFKGNILPIIDKDDNLYFFIKNDCDYKILLNIVSLEINLFTYLDNKTTKIVKFGTYKKNNQIKVFYMGQELFDFITNDIEKSSLLLFSNYVFKNSVGIDKISFSLSFLEGCKITTISNTPQNFYVKFIDKTTNKIVCEDNFLSEEPYILNREYFIDYDISIFNSNGKQIYNYSLDLKNKTAWIKLESKALGDTLSWIPYVDEFRKKYKCKVLCTTYWNDLFINQYPHINFISPTEIVKEKILFAVYKVQCSIPHKQEKSIVDYRDVSLQEIASKNLGLVHTEIKPLILMDNNPQLIDGEYVVISTMSTSKAKLWNYDGGWQKIVDYLASKSLRVVLLQKEKDCKLKNIINMSGTDDINNSINIVKYCKFFIGLSSGLSWLAWSLNKKVVMISGFTDPNVEFKENNYRVINTSVCHGCWCDKNHIFNNGDWFWCPRKKNFECTTSITPDVIINEINKLLDI